MLGDTAVAVNPNDERYKHLIGKKLLLPLKNKVIPIIADDYVDTEFGTGVVKITPAHDPNDYEVGLRHNLPIIETFTEDGFLNEEGEKYKGLSIAEARQAVVRDLEELGLLESTKDHENNVGFCYRCSTRIEPRVSKQWFVKMEKLAEPAIKVVRDGEIKFTPERFSKIYFNWLENIRDWCISRQLWWGHRIPAYYNDRTGEVFVSKEPLYKDPKTGEDLRQDEDSLDTWFSSALWPFSTMNWLENSEDFKRFYPTSVMFTGYDIIFFWVARMIFSGLEQTGKIPFSDVVLHGMVRDEHGRKMSKSLGNGIDPLEMIAEYGADQLRYSLVDQVAMGNDLRMKIEKIEAAGAFNNKIWNAFKFVDLYLQENLDFNLVDSNKFALEDRWILSRFHASLQKFERNIENYEVGVALNNIVSFIWEDFCDWYIEMIKPRLYNKEHASRLEAIYMLNHILKLSMQVLHPYMPFVTEEIYLHLVDVEESIVISKWPSLKPELIDETAMANMQKLMEAIKQIRALRLNLKVKNSQKSALYLQCHDKVLVNFFIEAKPYLEKMASVSELHIVEAMPEDNVVSSVISAGTLGLSLEGLVNKDEEIKRLTKEEEKILNELNRVCLKLENEEFVSKAPAKLVDVERSKKEKYEQMLVSIREQLAKF